MKAKTATAWGLAISALLSGRPATAGPATTQAMASTTQAMASTTQAMASTTQAMGSTTQATATTQAAAATRPMVDPRVAALVDQLDADAWQDRDVAAAELVAMGEAIRPAMVDAAAHGASPEVRSRAAGVIASLNRIAAERPTLVTLHLKDANPRVVFEALAKQSGLSMPVWPEQLWTPQFPGPVRAISLDADDRPFWDVMADVCGKAGVYPRSMGNQDDFALMQGTDAILTGPRSAIDPRYIVVAQSASRNRQVGYLAGGRSSSFDGMQFTLFTDPKVTILSAAPTATLTVAEDDHGRSMLPPPASLSQVPMNPFSHGHLIEFGATLNLPDAGYTKAVRLGGTLRVLVPTRTEHLVVDDVVRGVGQTVVAGVCTLRVDSCTVNDHNLSYRFTLSTPAARGVQQADGLASRLRLVDATGRAVGQGGGGCYVMNGQLVCQGGFGTSTAIRQPVRLTWDAPSAVRSMDVPFEFHDLPLPTP